jgi:hypothetical protein
LNEFTETPPETRDSMPLEKVQLLVPSTGLKITAMFNPEEYTINKDNNFAAQPIPGLSAPLVQFVSGNVRSLEMELFFDTYDTPDLPKEDVRDYTDAVIGLMAVDSELHAPPVVTVSWSSLQFVGVLVKASQKFVMFTDDGTPVRARVNVTFYEYVDVEQESKEVNRQTADFTKLYVVGDNDTLSGIAGKLYNDPGAWRAIAIANGIDDPEQIATGDSLLVPALPYTDPDTWEVLR